MTREDIARSLKPIKWTYTHHQHRYSAVLGVGGMSLALDIDHPIHECHLVVSRNGSLLSEGYKKYHKTLDEAMKEARSFLIDEVCSLFEVDQQ